MKIIKFCLFSLVLLGLTTPALADISIANDPSRIGVGARILGMGKGYIGMADDLGGIFINPAALSSVTEWQATSMSGRFINEYDYLNFGTAYPTEFGTFGIGYVGTGIGFKGPTATTEVVDGIRIIPSTTEGHSYEFNDSVVLLCWSSPLIEDLYTGATLKVFSLSMQGPGISGGNAAGNELDLGLHYTPPDLPIKAGLVLQNALPYDLGGRIRWQSGVDETLSAVAKAGLSYKILGDKGQWELGDHQLTFNLDADYLPTRANMPTLYHLGFEWAPMELLDLRLGIDQDYLGRGGPGLLDPTNDLTAGVGLYFGKFRFDYAFHQYSGLVENDSHYFSLTYGITRGYVPEYEGPPFLITPEDKSIIFTDYFSQLFFDGVVLDEDVQQVKVGDTVVPFEQNMFQVSETLTQGKNTFTFQGFRGEELIGQEKIRILGLKRFKDVPSTYWAAVPISLLAMEDIITGYPDGAFKPEGNITRAEMCTLLMKVKGVGDKELSVSPFRDVDPQHWAVNYIAAAADQKLVAGYPDGTFRPNANITRAEGAVILSRFDNLPKARVYELPFEDVAGRHWAFDDIAAAKAAGILAYLADKPFEADQELTRAEVAEMLSKTSFLAKKVNDMLDWDQDY
jgi:hypothetical protein